MTTSDLPARRLYRRLAPVLLAGGVVLCALDTHAQQAGPSGTPSPGAAAAEAAARQVSPAPAAADDAGVAVPNSAQLRVRAAFMAGYGKDGANATLGFENQGRVGYAIVTLEGRPHERVFYRVSMNPVNERDPRPGCGAPGYFFPNDPSFLYAGVPGPAVPCDVKEGHRRVDAYSGIALDVVPQQGAVREAFVDLRATGTFSVRFGRMRLPLGLDWEQAGSMTAKDAARIQRINAEANFMLMFAYTRPVQGRTRPLLNATLSAFLGEGNRWFDYDYFYFEDGTLDANSALSALASVAMAPTDTLEFRAAVKRGFTGSKVERLPSYWASKRNDDAVVASTSWAPIPYVRLMGEWARYMWGPTTSSAQLVGVNWAAITKQGYWFSAQGHWPVTPAATIGASVTREQVDRADSLVRYLAANGLYGVTTGRKDELTAVRLHLDLWKQVRIGFYKTFDRNPFPQISGIRPLAGPDHDSLSSTEKYGLVVRLTVD
jgi:hypothetical protein